MRFLVHDAINAMTSSGRHKNSFCMFLKSSGIHCYLLIIVTMTKMSFKRYDVFFLIRWPFWKYDVIRKCRGSDFGNIAFYNAGPMTFQTRGKVLSWEYRYPRKRNSRPPASVILCWVSWVENVLLIYYASSDLFVCLHWKKSPVYGVFGQ